MITARDEDSLEVIRHDAAHLLAEAVKELYPDVQVTIGPAIEDGFYYDFARNEPFTPADLEEIEARMAEIKSRDETVEREGLVAPTTLSRCSRAWASSTRRS